MEDFAQTAVLGFVFMNARGNITLLLYDAWKLDFVTYDMGHDMQEFALTVLTCYDTPWSKCLRCLRSFARKSTNHQLQVNMFLVRCHPQQR